jgi:hypothetical protein
MRLVVQFVASASERGKYWRRIWLRVYLSELQTGVRQVVLLVVGAASAL